MAAAPLSPSSKAGARYGSIGAPRTVHLGTPVRSHPVRPKLKKPYLTADPAAVKARKAAADQGSKAAGARRVPPAGNAIPATAAASGTALESLASFPAMGLEQQVADMGRSQAGAPANTQIGVGPNHVVEAVNANLSIWTRTGARVQTEDLAFFFSVPNGFAVSDPNVLYDAASGHWIMSAMAFNAAFDSRVYVAASQNADPTGIWYVYLVTSDSATLMDQPQLGNADDVIVISWGDFTGPCAPNCSFAGDEVWVLEKQDLISGANPLRRASFPPDLGAFGIIPARSLGATSGAAYLVYNNSQPLPQGAPGPTLALRTLTGQPSLNNVSFDEQFATIQETSVPPNAQQPGGAPALETGDDRLLSAVWQNGILWTAANDACPTPPGGCVRLFQLDTTTVFVNPTELGISADFSFDPAVSLDSAGNAYVVYNQSNTTKYPSLVATAVVSGMPSTSVVAGTASIDTGVCGLAPWRNYSGAAQDPVHPTDVWVAGAYGANGTDPCDWRSRIGRLSLSQPAITGFSPTVASRLGGTVVDIIGSDFVPGGTTVQFPSGPGTSVNVISPNELTAVAPASASNTSGVVTVTTANGTAASAGSMKIVPYQFSPLPIASNGTLTGNQSVVVTLTPAGGVSSYLSFSGVGAACVMPACTPLTGTPTFYAPTGGQIQVQYTAAAGPPTSGTATIHVQDAASSPGNTLDDTYTYTPVPTTLAFVSSSIEPTGDLVANTAVDVTLTARGAGNLPVPNTTVYLTLTAAAGGGAASVRNTPLSGSAKAFTTDANGQIAITYAAPSTLPSAGGVDIIHASTANPAVVDDTSYTYPPITTFYFAEGFTANGFNELLSLLMPNENGTVLIDYYTQTQHGQSIAFLTQGTVEPVDVNSTIGANQQVSMKVTLPGPGVAERTLSFSFGGWRGSTSIVGITQPQSTWYFAEGSTLGFFSEYLTLQNPNAAPVSTTVTYFTDSGPMPVKHLTLPPNSRTTIAVFDGDLTSPAGACAISGGNAVHCGVGRGIAGVSARITAAAGAPLIVERPFYVNNFSFGSGPIRDGHDAFGADAARSLWNFAEGTTLRGFNEYLTLQNPGSSDASVQLQYFTDAPGNPSPVKTLTVPANRRVTVEVFKGDLTTNPACSASAGSCGVGPNIGGVATQVTANQPIVVERPIYMVYNFGSGSVAGAHVALGASGLGRLFGFARGSTLNGENDYLTIQNPGPTTAHLTATYYTDTGVVVRPITVAPASRHTVEVFRVPEGSGPGRYPIGIVLESDQPVLVEKPTYSSNASTYGATDTLGYTPAGF